MNNQPHGPPGHFDRDRDAEEQRRQHLLHQQQEALQRERDHNERQERERQEREQYPTHQNNTGSIPIHQPVASRLPGAIHSPGGLLANHGGVPPSGPLGAPSGPGNAFGGPLHNEAPRSIQHNPQNATNQLQQQQGFGPNILHHNPAASIVVPGGSSVNFGGPLQQQQAPPPQDAVRLQQLSYGGLPQAHNLPGAPGLQQGGQQPILNDALSYLDQVKVQFADQPDVYNRFLDIMKDFKSQAIDTPGVINRVSELFAGHPNLIQGFNTFLPPGYRIECGTGNDPNSIRVTTPMGTTVQSIQGSGRALPTTMMGQTGGQGGYYGPPRANGWQPEPQHSIESPEAVFSPQNQNNGPSYGQNSGPSSYDAAAAAAAHQQQQRGVSQLTNAVATLGHPPRNAQTPTPGGQSGVNGGASHPSLEKRGPVEFNHAISYVNKIKNRFQDRPEIYKQFLEILQTYQRESKPIQDVYAQVTFLFNTAPDLLEDFKQFLPESAAQAKAAAAAKAAEEAAMSNQTPQHGARGEAKMPPVGNFSVAASATKESKKRPRNNAVAPPGSQVNVVGESARTGGPGSANNKRSKLVHPNKAADVPIVSPTLTPVVPEPLPPTSTASASSEELAFFDRVKKYIGNKQTMNEFLKLCNMFSQDLIDRNILVHRISSFIGGNPDLMNWFKTFVSYDGGEEVIINRPKPPTGRVSLSNCRGLGPSYRLLPKRERLKPCSGRDEMCKEVLNDDWASHPTWASEDSGFVAHRKNTFEESLHRIEEERHDYDFNIEANSKVIQLLEPIAQSILSLTPAERAEFRTPLGLGTQTRSIYNRVFKKIYGDRGPQVVADLFKDPCAVLPVVLPRLKQKDEEWRTTQREWEKIWHSQTSAAYLKSLDHMGITAKTTDKKLFAPKAIIDNIKTKYEEQKRNASTLGKSQRHQFTYSFTDEAVIADVLRIMIVYATNSAHHNNAERRRIADFFEKFIAHFFNLSIDTLTECTRDVDRGTPEEESEEAPPAEVSNSRKTRPTNGKKTNDLRRGVLEKNRGGRGRNAKEDSASGSKESTPDVDPSATENIVEDPAVTEVTNERWAVTPGAVAIPGTKALFPEDVALEADQTFTRNWYRLYANQTIFVFFTVFHHLYERFKLIKDSEAAAVEEGVRITARKPAQEVGLMPEKDTYFQPIEQPGVEKETYYFHTLQLVEDFIVGDLEEAKYQEFLRNYHLKNGWKLYSIIDVLKLLCKHGVTCSSTDSKEKSPEILSLFYLNRKTEETSYNAEINMRKQVDKYNKDGELFMIQWNTTSSEAHVQWVQKEDTTFNLDELERLDRWKYYTSSYVRIEPTEGIPRQKMRKSVLQRNVEATKPREDSEPPPPIVYAEDLVLRICVNSSKMLYKDPGSEYFVYTSKTMSGGAVPLTGGPSTQVSDAGKRIQKNAQKRKERFQEIFVLNNKWMEGLTQDQVEEKKRSFAKWVEDGVVPSDVNINTL